MTDRVFFIDGCLPVASPHAGAVVLEHAIRKLTSEEDGDGR